MAPHAGNDIGREDDYDLLHQQSYTISPTTITYPFPETTYTMTFPNPSSWNPPVSFDPSGHPVFVSGTSTTTFEVIPTSSPLDTSLTSTRTTKDFRPTGIAAESQTYSFPTGFQTTSSSFPSDGPAIASPQVSRRGPIPAIVAIGIIIPLILLALSIAGFFFCIRRRKRASDAGVEGAGTSLAAVPQMKSVAPRTIATHSERPYIHTPAATPAAMPTPASTTNTPTTATSPPVILSTTMNNTYYTGIDTSDHISLSDRRSQTSAESLAGDEPPPPYRPRSVPPMSRETSVRMSGTGRNSSIRSRHDPMQGAGLIRRSEEVLSPFDDPESSDDDAVSQISTLRSYPRRAGDQLSVVSDLSYQEDVPAQSTRPGV